MISHEHKCIFIHVPKVAGSSIEQKLGLFQELKGGVQDHRPLHIIEPKGLPKAVVMAFSKVSKSYKKEAYYIIRDYLKPPLSKKQYQEYYKFCVVRNSWSRSLSYYRSFKRDSKLAAALHLDQGISFKTFLQSELGRGGLRSQLHWLVDSKGDLPYDKIARFENLNHDFMEIASNIGLKDAQLPHLLAHSKASYMDYFDDETVDIVYKSFKKEIEIFGFEYGE